jgi:hypothetical protein
MSLARLNLQAIDQIREKVRQSLKDPETTAHDEDALRVDPQGFGVLSTGEKIAVALVLDRYDLLDGYGMLDAVDRLGPEWFAAALYVKRNGWALEQDTYEREQGLRHG